MTKSLNSLLRKLIDHFMCLGGTNLKSHVWQHERAIYIYSQSMLLFPLNEVSYFSLFPMWFSREINLYESRALIARNKLGYCRNIIKFKKMWC